MPPFVACGQLNAQRRSCSTVAQTTAGSSSFSGLDMKNAACFTIRVGIAMASEPTWVSVTADPRGEPALAYLPARDVAGEKMKIYAAPMTAADSAIAVSLRATIEHFSRYMEMPVALEPPADAATARLLRDLLGESLPENFDLADGCAWPEGSRLTEALMPARRIESFEEADATTGALPGVFGPTYGWPQMRYLAAAFGVLVENGLQHAENSSIDVVAGMAYDRRDDVVRLVVVDSGRTIASLDESEDVLLDALERSEERNGGLAWLVQQPTARELDVSAILATGQARAYREGGSWRISPGQYVAGFAAVVSVPSH